MRRTLGVSLVLMASIAACSSTTPPTPAPTVAPSMWDPRRDQIDQSAAIWAKHRPVAYAYTFDHAGPPGEDQPYRYRASSLEGDVELQHVSGRLLPAEALETMTFDGLYDVARDSLAGPAFTFAFDPLLGYPTQLSWTSAAEPSAGGAVETVDAFTTAADRESTKRARAALESALTRWRAVDAKTWEYTWSRIPAGSSTAAPETWTVRHAKGKTTATSKAGGALTPSDVSFDGTVLAIQNVLGSGGWVDVATEEAPGLGVLIAVDPQPGAKGDAYWLRIAWTDLALRAAVTEIEAAKARWATAQLTDYSYLWAFQGDDGNLAYRVSRDGEKATVKPENGSPAPEARSYAAPRIEDTFAMIEAVLAQGGRVDATFDANLGYPVRVEMTPAGDAGAKGVITIKNLKRG